MKEEKTVKIKTVRPCVCNGNVVDKNTILTMTESKARLFLGSGKAVVAGDLTRDDDAHTYEED